VDIRIAANYEAVAREVLGGTPITMRGFQRYEVPSGNRPGSLKPIPTTEKARSIGELPSVGIIGNLSEEDEVLRALGLPTQQNQ